MCDFPDTQTHDQELLDQIFERAVQQLEEGLPVVIGDLLGHREDLLGQVERLVRLAQQVVAGHPRTLPAVRGYTILGELGQGGMGTVYLARQERLGRPIALKVLSPSTALSHSARERFRTEALAIARLQHPNIVAVHDVVHEADVYAYAMEWVDGKSLAELISHLERCGNEPAIADVRMFLDAPSGAHEHATVATFICRVGIAIGRALGAVHRAGLLHRDVKPANVLLRRDGTPLLSDFGLARELDTATVTQAGHFVGTPAYAAPEQLRGSSDGLDARTDVYGLGATLYHALTLRLPFRGASTTDLLRQIEAGQAEALRCANPHLSVDLQTIVAKAMDADPARRYPTADELADDLERLLHLQPIHARPAGLLTRTVKLARRNRGVLVAGLVSAAFTAALLAALAVYFLLVPRWVDEHVTTARLTLLDPEQGNKVFAILFFGNDNLGRPAVAPAALRAALGEYDAALRWRPWAAEIRREREVAAQALASAERPIPLPGREGAGGGVDAAALRETGLFALLTGDPQGALDAWTRLDLEREPDAFVEATLGILHLANDEPARAYPRLQKACEAFPNVGFLTTYLADAALKCGDIEKAARWLDAAEQMPHQDPQGGVARVRAGLAAARGQVSVAISAYRGITAQNPVAILELARLLEAGGSLQQALEIYRGLWREVPGKRPRAAFVACADRWWAAVSPEERFQKLRAALDAPSAPDSLALLLREYQQALAAPVPLPGREGAGGGFLSALRPFIPMSLHPFFQLIAPFLGADSSPSLQTASLREWAEILEVHDMSHWSTIAKWPTLWKNWQVSAWGTPWGATVAKLRRVRERAMAAGAALSIGVIASAQTVPGYQVHVYANVTDPVMLSFDSAGTLYAGRDANGSGGGSGDPVKVHKVGPGGSPVIEWGANSIDDPDSVVVDETGVISGVPGSVLVGGMRYNTAIGEIHAVRPDQSVVLLYSSTQFQNVMEMKFDSTNRLVFASIGYSGNPSGVFVSTGSAPTRLFSLPFDPFGLAFDAANNIYVSCADGKVRVYSAAGSLINGNYATLASWAAIEFGVGGALGADLFALEIDTGNIERIDGQGNASLFGTGFATDTGDLAFGPDGALYAGVFSQDIIYRITPAPVVPGYLNCDGSVSFGDINPFVLYLSNFATWQTTYAGCNPINGDINDDGTYPAFSDINPFVALLSGGS